MLFQVKFIFPYPENMEKQEYCERASLLPSEIIFLTFKT